MHNHIAITYYAARAPYYEAIYAKPERQLDRLRYLEATLGAEPAPSGWPKRRRWRDEAPTPSRAHPTRLAPAVVIR